MVLLNHRGIQESDLLKEFLQTCPQNFKNARTCTQALWYPALVDVNRFALDLQDRRVGRGATRAVSTYILPFLLLLIARASLGIVHSNGPNTFAIIRTLVKRNIKWSPTIKCTNSLSYLCVEWWSAKTATLAPLCWAYQNHGWQDALWLRYMAPNDACDGSEWIVVYEYWHEKSRSWSIFVWLMDKKQKDWSHRESNTG